MTTNELKEESRICLPLMRFLTSLQKVMTNYHETDRILGIRLLLLLREISIKERIRISRFIQACHQLSGEQLEADDELQRISSEVRRHEEIQLELEDDVTFDMGAFDAEGNYDGQATVEEIIEQISPEIGRAVGGGNDKIRDAGAIIFRTVEYLSHNEPATVETIAQHLEIQVIFAAAFLNWLETLGLILRMPGGVFTVTQNGYNLQRG